MAVQIDVGADNPRIAREETCPGLMAKHERVSFGALERRPSEQNARPERFEIVIRDERGCQRTALGCHEARALGDNAIEQVGSIAQLLIVAPAEGLATRFLRSPAYLVER